MLVHSRVNPSIKFASIHLYSWMERGTVRVKCLAHEHNAMFPARSQTRTARSGVERTNHNRYAYGLRTIWSSDFFGRIWKMFAILMCANMNASCFKDMSATYHLGRLPAFMTHDSTRDNDTVIQLFHKLQGLWGKVAMKAGKWFSYSPKVLEIDLFFHVVTLLVALQITLNLALIHWHPRSPNPMLCRRYGPCSLRNGKINVGGKRGKCLQDA